MKILQSRWTAISLFLLFLGVQPPESLAQSRPQLHHYMLKIDRVKTKEDIVTLETLLRRQENVSYAMVKYGVKGYWQLTTTVPYAETAWQQLLEPAGFSLSGLADVDKGEEEQFLMKYNIPLIKEQLILEGKK